MLRLIPSYPFGLMIGLMNCIVLTSLSTLSLADDWPQFRGPTGQGTVAETGIPIHWSPDSNVAWACDIPGKGWSSPVIRGNQVWLTTAVETPATEAQIEAARKRSGMSARQFSQQRVIGQVTLKAICVHRNTGKVLHDVDLFQLEMPDSIHSLNSYASPTPVIVDQQVVCHFGANGTACLNVENGQVLWKKSIKIQHGVGAGSSPVAYQDLIILVCDGMDKQFITAVNRLTGETAWTTPRPPIRATNGDMRKAYCTPLLVADQGREQLIIPGAQWVCSYDPASGKELWRVDHGSGFSNVPRPVYQNGVVYICTGFMRPELWAIRVDGTGDVSETHVLWRQSQQIPTMPSPLLVGQRIYTLHDRGILTCFDIKTGESLFRERIGGNFSASPLLVGDRVYLMSREGEVTVFKEGAQYKQLAQFSWDAQFMASPAIVGNTMYVRTDQQLLAVHDEQAAKAE